MSGKNDSVLSEIDKLLKNVDTTGMEGGAKRKRKGAGCGCTGKSESKTGHCGTRSNCTPKKGGAKKKSKSKGHCNTKTGHTCGKGHCNTKSNCGTKKGGSKCDVMTICGDNSGPCSVSPSCGGAKKKSKSKAKKSKSKSKSKAKKMVKKLVKKIKSKSKSKAKKTKSKSKAKKAKIARYMDSEMFGGAKKKSKSKSKGKAKVAKKSKSKSKGKKVKREPNMFIKTLMEVKKHVKKMDLPEDVKDGPAMTKIVAVVMKAKDMDAKKSVEHIKDNFSKFLNDYKKTQHEMEKKRAAKKAAKSA
tara:strand:+ start:84 stop:986 length:903 start_codon:yes stop_codon:yes gene_type:complete